jgi:excisionase family DNA binding protein
MKCNRCGATFIYCNYWPACPCDAIPGLTLTVREAARFMSVSRGGIYHWIEDGYLAANRTRRPIRISMTALKAVLTVEHIGWLNRRATGSESSL